MYNWYKRYYFRSLLLKYIIQRASRVCVCIYTPIYNNKFDGVTGSKAVAPECAPAFLQQTAAVEAWQSDRRI